MVDTYRTQGNPVDERTPTLGLPLPNRLNDSRDDVERLRQALDLIDAAQQLVELALADKAEDTELAALSQSMAQALSLKASTASLNALAQSTNDALALKASADALANAVTTLNTAIATKAASTTPTITGLREVRLALGAGSQINVAGGNLFTKTVTGATNFSVTNVPAAGTVACFLLDLTNGGSAAVTWWAGCKWSGGVAPLLTAAGRDLLGFVTHDGGATWTGTRLAKDAK